MVISGCSSIRSFSKSDESVLKTDSFDKKFGDSFKFKVIYKKDCGGDIVTVICEYQHW